MNLLERRKAAEQRCGVTGSAPGPAHPHGSGGPRGPPPFPPPQRAGSRLTYAGGHVDEVEAGGGEGEEEDEGEHGAIGDAQHWLACALYAACRRSVLPTVGSGVMEGNCVSLTRILRSARLRCAARDSAEAEGRLKPMITQRFLYRLFFFCCFCFSF